MGNSVGDNQEPLLTQALAHDWRLKYPLARLARMVATKLETRERLVLELRETKTLRDIGETLGVTRERIRQIEEGAGIKLTRLIGIRCQELVASSTKRLAAPATAETDLFGPWADPALPSDVQFLAGRMLIRSALIEATAPRIYTGRLHGWWTTQPETLLRRLQRCVDLCPTDDEGMSAAISELGLPDSFPVLSILRSKGSPVRYDSVHNAWVRRLARHRDTAVVLLLRQGAPLSAAVLADKIGTNASAMSSNFSRDDRFRQLKPSRLWALTEWSHLNVSTDDTTLDAVLAVLRESGPSRPHQLAARVTARFPVTGSAVAHCYSSSPLVGRLGDGRIGLVSEGAVFVPRRAGRRPRTVTRHEPDRVIEFQKTINRDMLRGSGSGIPSYVGSALGLVHHGDKRVFSLADGSSLTFGRSVSNWNMSSVRHIVGVLEACGGSVMVFRLDLTDDSCACWLKSSKS